MRHSSSIVAAAVTAAALVGTPAALARTTTIGEVSRPPINNVCLFMVDCTYVNAAHGKPDDVVKHGGIIVSWSALQCGAVQLRVLRPAGHERFMFVRSTVVRAATAPGVNTFPAHLAVRAGDVLALRDVGSSAQSSCLMFAAAGPARSVSYFRSSPLDGSRARLNASTLTDQHSGQGDAATPHLRVLFTATERS